MIAPHNAIHKERMLTAPYTICIERALCYTQSFKKTKNEHPALRAAKAFAHTLNKMSIYILEEERIAGNRASAPVAVVIPVERGDINTVLNLDLDNLTSRKEKPYHISPNDRKKLKNEILPYWRGKTLRDKKKRLFKRRGLFFTLSFRPIDLYRRRKSLDMQKMMKTFASDASSGPVYAWKGLTELLYNNPALLTNIFDVQGHLILGHKNILKEGFAGIKKQATEQLNSIQVNNNKQGKQTDKTEQTEQAEKTDKTEHAEKAKHADKTDKAEQTAFLKALIICCDAMRNFALRYAAEAERLASETTDKHRKEELLAIAKRCRHVPYYPPRDFAEAVQALWLTQVGAHIAYGKAGILAVGRIDQYLYPFYAEDKKKNRIDDNTARELLEELLIKLSCGLMLIPHMGKKTASEFGSDSASPTVGGITPDGKDAANELSYLCIDAFNNIKSMGNSFTIRLSEKNPPLFWDKAVETYRHTSGAALYYDEIAVQALKKCGYTEEDARDYGVIGCVEPAGDGNTFGCTSGNDLSMVAALEMTLLNGYLRIMGKNIGPRTGDVCTFHTFEQLLAAYQKQLRFLIGIVARGVNLKDTAYFREFPSPYISATLDGCLENACDMTRGGTKYSFSSMGARGFGTTVDSLAAIKEFVYDNKDFTIYRLLKAIDSNFRGEEKLRMKLLNKGPKYGSGHETAVKIAVELAAFYCSEVAKQINIFGTNFRPGFFSYGMHVLDGLLLGATPDGRLAGEPVSNSFSPVNNTEKNGPTTVLKSVASIDHTLISNGCALNIKLHPNMVEGEERLQKVKNMLKTFFELGGMEIQPNVINNETLKAAQAEPESYRDLVVRVSGYSAFFTDLGKPLQDELINRTEFVAIQK